MKAGFKVIAGFLTGAVAGSILGILLAPASGKKTRKLISHKVKDIEEDVELVTKRGLRHAKDAVIDRIEDVVEAGKGKYNSLKAQVTS